MFIGVLSHAAPEAEEVDGHQDSPAHHRISKQDISNPTKTTGPLFKTGHSLDSDEEDNLLTLTQKRTKVREAKREGGEDRS